MNSNEMAVDSVVQIKKDEDTLYVGRDEYDYLVSLLGENTLKKGDWSAVENKTKLVLALFAVHKYSDAWNAISKNIANIDYNTIKHGLNFKINPNFPEVFDYLYENNIIDDKEYSYYEVISGKLNPVFWNEYIKKNNCQSFTDICDLINQAYNGLSRNDCPLVNMDIYVESLMDVYLKEGETLDDFVYDKPAFLFPISKLYQLIDMGHFENPSKILFIISNIIDTATEQEMFWRYVSNNLSNDDNIFAISGTNMLTSLLDNTEYFMDSGKEKLFLRLLINSPETPAYRFTIEEKLAKYNISLEDINISDYLEDINMALSVHYMMVGLNVKSYVFLNSTTKSTFVVWNSDSYTVLLGDKLYDAYEFSYLDMFDSFKDDPDYAYHEMSKFENELYNYCGKDKLLFNELMYAIQHLQVQIREGNEDDNIDIDEDI